MNWGDNMERMMSEAIETLIGDTPVSEQLGAALSYMAPREHIHDNYVSREEFETLKKQVNLLLDLVGDISVAEQIMAVLQRKGG